MAEHAHLNYRRLKDTFSHGGAPIFTRERMERPAWLWILVMTPPRSGKLRENPFLNELHEEKPNLQNRDFADSIKCQSGNIAYIPSEPNAHGFLLVT